MNTPCLIMHLTAVNVKTFWASQDICPALNSHFVGHASNNAGHWLYMSCIIYDFTQDIVSCIDWAYVGHFNFYAGHVLRTGVFSRTLNFISHFQKEIEDFIVKRMLRNRWKNTSFGQGNFAFESGNSQWKVRELCHQHSLWTL